MRIRRRKPLARSSKLIARSAKPIKRGKRPRRQRKTPLGTLKRQLWALFSRYVKDRDGDRCVTCGAGGLQGQNQHAGHFVSTARAATRYDPKNVHVQCARCNVFLRGNGAAYAAFIVATYGPGEITRLVEKSNEIKNWTRPELEELVEALKRGGDYFELAYYERYL